MVRTRVGYAGASTDHPTYRDLRGHTEALQIEFDASRITYDTLLDVFWDSHDPTAAPWSTQYKAVLWYHDEEQRAAALASRDRVAERLGKDVQTEIVPAGAFWRAEDYHQKYRLQNRSALADRVRALCDGEQGFVDSTLAARLNGVLAGYVPDAGVVTLLDDPELGDSERRLLAEAAGVADAVPSRGAGE